MGYAFFFFMVGAALTADVAPAAAQEDAFSLDGLIVTASPFTVEEEAVTSDVTVVDGDRLRRFGDRGLAEALEDVPGVHLVRNGSFGSVTSLFLRGGESDHALILVDGVQVNQPGGGFDLAELTTRNVERVEIMRGPGSAIYGSDAMTGVVHIITRTGRGSPVSSVRFEGGSFGRRDWRGSVRGGTARASYSVAVARDRTDGILPFNNASTNTTLSGAAKLRPDDATRLDVNLRLSDRTYRFPTDGNGAVVDRNAFTFSDRTTARLAVARALTRRIEIQAAVGLSEVDGGTDDDQDSLSDTLGFYAFESFDHVRRSVAEVRSQVRLDPVTLSAGFEFEEERQRSFTESMSEFGPSTGRSENERDNRGYFLHASGHSSGVAYQGGVRLDDNERFGTSTAWHGGLAVTLPGSPSTRLRGSFGTAIKEPTFFENFATGFARGNPDLDPERSTSWDVGVTQSLLRGAVTLGVTYFDQRFEDLIQFTSSPPDPADPSYFNVAEATARGVEASLDGARGPWSLGVSWTWSDTEVSDSGFDEGEGATFVEGEALLRRPRHRGALRVAYATGRVDLGARVVRVGERSDRDFSTFPASPLTMPSYTVVAAGGVWRALEAGDGRPSVSVELRGENLFDKRYEDTFGFRSPGRGIYAGLSVGFGR